MPTPYPPEFRRDVIAVARQGEQSKEQVARSFGISASCLARWLRIADREDTLANASDASDDRALQLENRQLRQRTKQLSRRTRACAERPPTSPARPSQHDVPAGRRPGRRQDRCRGDLPGARVLQASLRPVARQPLSQRDWDDAHLINAAIDIYHDDPEFGYRFSTDELARLGITASRNRVNRLCTQQRLFSRHARKHGLHRTPGPPVHDDLVARRFTAAAPDRLWLTDITEHPTTDGKLYLCAIKDACTNRIVGYSMADRMTARLAVDALTNAVALRHPSGTVVHSDRGSQFRSHAYVRALRGAGLHGSMGRVGACADNAAMESFFSLLQKNVLNRRRWATREQLRLAIVVWIERTYHRRRRQDSLGRLTPIEYETLLRATHAP